MNAVNVSYDSSGPWIGPDSRDSSLQLVPNSKPSTIPDTTPMPNATPKILSQKSNTRRHAGRPVIICSASSAVSHAASPIVNDGKMMWNDTVKANCRLRKQQGRCGHVPLLPPEIAAREVEHLVGLPAEDGLDRVERKALGHLGGDGWRHGQFLAVHHRVDQHRAVVRQGLGNARLHVFGFLQAYAANPDGLGHGREVGIVQFRAGVDEAS